MTDIVDQLRHHRVVLKSGEYDGADIMRAWCCMVEAAVTIEQLRARIECLEKRLEVVPGWSEDADGIACRDDTIRLQDERNTRQQARIAELQGDALANLQNLMEPSEAMLAAAVPEPVHLYGKDGRDEDYQRQMKAAVAIERLSARQKWQDMLTAAIRERTDGR